ncbi:MAG: class I SAM-dependent methyltransferase [Gammaproteobacteria bacterium]|nr:class I SAM-dependent methyltransferase [Gammaproteobacteria bacterium]
MGNKIKVVTNDPSLSKDLGLSLIVNEDKGSLVKYDFFLFYQDDRLLLQDLKAPRTKSICVDFLQGKAAHRHKYGGGKNQIIARAVGVKDDFRPSVIDATGGFGGDAFVLASLGCNVRLIERSPVVAALLRDGLRRLKKSAFTIGSKITLIESDAFDYFSRSCTETDVVYLDPMFPTRTKSALVKKEMRVLKKLVGSDIDSDGLLSAALKVSRRRVAVKRPKLAQPLANKSPDLVFKGKSSRFDVYINKRKK